MSQSENPFASPQAETGAASLGAVDLTEAERIRKAHLNHEAEVRSIGMLYYLGGIILGAMGIAMLVFVASGGPQGAASSLPVVVLYIVLGLLFVVLGRGLRILHPFVRIPVVIFAALGLLAFPCGTMINGYFLYLILSAKGGMVLSAEYKEIIRQTPHVKYKTSLLSMIVLAIFLAILAIILFTMFVV